MRRVVAPLASGVLSALGLIVSERRRDIVESVLLGGEALTREAVAEAVGRLGEQARSELGERDAELRAVFDLRYAGQAFELSIDGPLEAEPDELRRAFDSAHDERYGYSDPDAELELVTIRVAAALPGAELPAAATREAERRGSRRALFDGDWVDARCSARERPMSTARRSSSSPARRSSCPRAGARARTRAGW